MTSYRDNAFKIYEHEQILKHHYRRLHGVRPTITSSIYSKQRSRIAGTSKKQQRKRERKMWLRHQKMLKNLQQAERKGTFVIILIINTVVIEHILIFHYFYFFLFINLHHCHLLFSYRHILDNTVIPKSTRPSLDLRFFLRYFLRFFLRQP